MHVLWFTGVELPAVTGGKLTRAGWQEGLRNALYQFCPDIELSIASFGSRAYQPFQTENATYYNILKSEEIDNRWQRVWNAWQHRTFQEEDLERSFAVYQQVQPDLVFVFGTENPFGLLSDHIKVPVVISIQAVLNGLVNHLFDGLTLLELVREFFSRSTLTGNGLYHKWWSRKKSAYIEKKIYRQVQYFCGRTNWDRSWQIHLNPQGRYFHVDRVLRRIFYESTWDPTAADDQRIFSLTGNAAFKGGSTLVRAMVKLKSMGFDQLQLHLGGVDKDSMVGKNITNIINRYELQNQVHLLGRLEGEQIIMEMQVANLFVFPSHLDNSPNSLAEAMMMGMPCIASNAGGIPSMIKDGEEGLVYPHDDINSLVDNIIELLADPIRAQKLGRNARKTARKRHDPERIARALSEVYQRVLADRKTK